MQAFFVSQQRVHKIEAISLSYDSCNFSPVQSKTLTVEVLVALHPNNTLWYKRSLGVANRWCSIPGSAAAPNARKLCRWDSI